MLYISECEMGKRRVLAIDLPDLSRALDVPIAYFFEGELGETDLDRALLESFHHLPTVEFQRLVIRMLDELSATVVKHCG